MPDDPDDVTISYTVKEKLGAIERAQAEGFARIEESLKSRASKADIAELAGRIDVNTRRIEKVEVKLREDETREKTQETITQARRDRLSRIWSALAGIGTAALVILTWIIASGHI